MVSKKPAFRYVYSYLKELNMRLQFYRYFCSLQVSLIVPCRGMYYFTIEKKKNYIFAYSKSKSDLNCS